MSRILIEFAEIKRVPASPQKPQIRGASASPMKFLNAFILRSLPNVTLVAFLTSTIPCCFSQTANITTQRGDATVLIEPYAPNIIRVSLSLRKDDALAAPGYGIVAQPSAADWSLTSSETGDTLKSASLVVTVASQSKLTVR